MIAMTPKEWLISWFEQNSSLEKEEICNNLGQNYLLLGWIDSFQFINFICEIENAFGVHFSNDEFQDRKFASIEGLSEIIEVKMHVDK